jgi:hypothetical protein
MVFCNKLQQVIIIDNINFDFEMPCGKFGYILAENKLHEKSI